MPALRKQQSFEIADSARPPCVARTTHSSWNHTGSQACDRLFGTLGFFPKLRRVGRLNLAFDHHDNQTTPRVAAEAVMNHSFYSADRTTHLKIVVVALLAATAVAGIGITARVNTGDNFAQIDRAQVIKAGKPMMVTTSGQTVVR
jgi:hypothetical protein